LLVDAYVAQNIARPRYDCAPLLVDAYVAQNIARPRYDCAP